MARPTVKDADFVGKAAYLAQRAIPPAAILCTLTVDDPTSSSGVKRYMLGREPVTGPTARSWSTPRAAARTRRAPARRPRSASTSCSSYLPPEAAVEGTKLAVEYFGERYPVTVAVVGSTPIFDPENARIRA